MTRASLILPLVLLAGCVERIAESRVRTALVGGGLSDRMAGCMAERMVDRLSIGQLRKLEALEGLDGRTLVRLSLPQFIERVRRVGDPEVLAVVTTSGAVCALR